VQYDKRAKCKFVCKILVSNMQFHTILDHAVGETCNDVIGRWNSRRS